MNFLRDWILPPLVGAVIGYFTNWLAIKMLFRPLKPVYLGKLRLPFTPGILPRERSKLTVSVGDTVSKELLTPEVFRSRLSDETLRTKLEQSVRGVLDDLLSADAGKALKSLSTQPGEKSAPGIGTVVASSFASIVGSREFRLSACEAAVEAAVSIGRLPLREILGPEKVGEFARRAVSIGASDPASRIAESIVKSLLGTRGEGELALFPPRAVAPLVELASRTIYAKALPIARKILADESLKSELETMAMGIVRRAVQRMGFLQRLIVTAANYEKTLAEMMPDTIQDLTEVIMDLLKSPELEQKVMKSATDTLGSLSIAGDEVLAQNLVLAFARFFEGLEADKDGFAARAQDRYEAQADKSLSDILPAFPSLVEAIATEALGKLAEAGSEQGGAASEIIRKAMDHFSGSYSARLEGSSLKTALGLNDTREEELASAFAQAAVTAISSQADRLVEALDVKTMVVERIESLDMAEVERLILQVVNSELTWITVLGGVLGGLIGIIQSLIYVLWK
jgi:uncharacterized membrane-anchored protein YjiN (DUF445 family)